MNCLMHMHGIVERTLIMDLNEKQTFLLEKLNAIPPILEEIDTLIKEGDYSSDDISLIGAAFIDDYYVDFDTSASGHYIRIEPQAPYVYEIVKLTPSNEM